ncbi:MAG TPA: amino acid ABC transporter substrate-binding protein [Vicinamibacteria bacterium]|nr:amino acid ABC transporter substrate-binding protein [Vicinamibacteria bacterium]
MADAIRFGASISTSGRYALQGCQALAGLQAWAKATNAEGGVRLSQLGERLAVTLIHYDDASSQERAVANLERLISVDRVHVLIGPYASDLTRAAVRVARQHGKLLWNHGGASDDIHRPGAGVVGISTPASRYFGSLLELVRSFDADAQKAAVLYRRGSRFGRQAARGARAADRRAGFVVAALAYSSLPEDLPQLMAKLCRQRPDLILGAGSFEDDCAIAREGIAAGVRTKAFALTAAAMWEFGQTLGTGAEGILAPSQWEPDARYAVDFGPSPSQVTERIRAMGRASDYPAAQAYAACLIAQRCLEEAGSADDEALWRGACDLDCTTFFGRFGINPRTGMQVGHEMVWVQWQGGRKVVVWPPSVAQARPVYPRS